MLHYVGVIYFTEKSNGINNKIKYSPLYIGGLYYLIFYIFTVQRIVLT